MSKLKRGTVGVRSRGGAENGCSGGSNNTGSSCDESDGEGKHAHGASGIHKNGIQNGKTEEFDKRERQKEKKRRQRENRKKREALNSLSSVGDEEGLDLNSAFVAKAASRTKALSAPVGGPSGDRETYSRRKGLNSSFLDVASGGNGGGDSGTIETLGHSQDPKFEESRQLVIKGNILAHGGKYGEAIYYFDRAIACFPKEYRFFGNRSFCHEQLGSFHFALQDAEKAIELAPLWPKGFFRKGCALKGLRRFPEAEEAFQEVLSLDSNCPEARQELIYVQVRQLMEMGFPEGKAKQALTAHGSVQAAIEAFLSSGTSDMRVDERGLDGGNDVDDEIFFSDDDDEAEVPVTVTFPPPAENGGAFHPVAQKQSLQLVHQHQPGPFQPPPQPQASSAADNKMDPNNPEGLSSLWVGNLQNNVKEADLKKIFSKHGEVLSIRILPEKFCAFVNYRTKAAAGLAMKHLQGYIVGGKDLLIRFPDKPMEKTLAGKALKQTGGPVPVAGDECYFWRTYGCRHGTNCRFKHIPDHRGIDRKPWQNPT